MYINKYIYFSYQKNIEINITVYSRSFKVNYEDLH